MALSAVYGDGLRHLRNALKGNGYPTGWVKLNQNMKQRDREGQEPLTTAIIPYNQGVSEQIKRVLRQYNIRTAFKSGTSLGNMLSKVKDPLLPEDRSGVIYKLGCLCGDFYIGQTGRSVNTRIKEHKVACRLAKLEKSAVTEHAWQDGHVIEWDQAEIVDAAKSTWERLVKEAIHITLAPPGCRMNKDEGMDLSPLWMNAILAMRDRQRRMQDRRRTPPIVPRPPSTPPPNIRRPTPTLRRRLTSHAAPSPTTWLRPRPLT